MASAFARYRLASAAPLSTTSTETGSLGVSGDYTAAFIGKVPFWLEVNEQMPRSYGRNQIHISQIAGYTEVDYPLLEIEPPAPTELDRRIASFVAERIPNGSTIQTGIGSVPNAIMAMLKDHEHLGVHTELLSDGLIDLVDAGALTGVAKSINPGKIVTTFVLGTKRVYDFVDVGTPVFVR